MGSRRCSRLCTLKPGAPALPGGASVGPSSSAAPGPTGGGAESPAEGWVEGPWPLEVPRAVASGRWRRAWVGRREPTTPRVPRWHVGPAAWAGGVGGLLWGASVGGVPRRLGPQYHPGSLGPRPLWRVPGWREVQGAAGKAGCASRAAWSGSFLLIRPRFPLVGGPRAPAGPSPQKAGSTAAGREGGKALRAAGDSTLLSGLVAAGDREPFWTCRC